MLSNDGSRPRYAANLRDLRGLAQDVIKGFGDYDLLSFASAIAFQVLFSLVPLALAGLAVLGFLGLGDVWDNEIAPTVKEQVPEDAFSVIERTVDQIFAERRGLWLTFGLGFALWQVSGAVRAAMGPLNTIYETDERRSWLRRLAVSVGLAAVIAPCLLLALIGISLGDDLSAAMGLEGVAAAAAFVVRWAIGIALMFVAIWLILRFAPARSDDVRWISFGSGLVVAVWVLASLGYGLYVSQIASYGHLFAGLASVIVLMTYVYVLAVAFLAGVQADACWRRRANGR